MNPVLAKQFSLDYCCPVEEVLDKKNHFHVFSPLEGRRRYNTSGACFFSFASVNGKLLMTGREDVVTEIGSAVGDADGRWFFDAPAFVSLENRLLKYGYRISMAHPFYIAENVTPVRTEGYKTEWFELDEIERFRGDSRFENAFGFHEYAPDVVGVAAYKNGEIAGMAGASLDSPYLWQIGIDVMPGFEGKGVGTMLVRLLKNEVLERGALPYYGTGFAHLASQRVALKAGFWPAWTELAVKPVPKEN